MATLDWATAGTGLGVLAVATATALLAYRDGTSVGVSRPRLLAGLVGGSVGSGLAVTLLGPAPPQGALVLVALGPIVYLFERYDATESATDPDPHRLPIDQRSAEDEPAPTETEVPTDDDGSSAK